MKKVYKQKEGTLVLDKKIMNKVDGLALTWSLEKKSINIYLNGEPQIKILMEDK